MRYIWSAFLLVAAVLAPDTATVVILLVLGSVTLLLTLLRERKVSRLTDELSDLLAVKRKTGSVAMERSLSRVQRNTLGLAIVSELIVFIALLIGQLDITVARNYALLILVALAPVGLEIELFALLRSKQKKGSETVRSAIGYASEDAHALLAVTGLSFVGTVWLNIPAALSAMQMLFILCVARPILSGRALQALPHKINQGLRVGLTACIVYGSFIFYFIRHYLEPRYADASNVAVWQATAVAFASFVACQCLLLFFETRRLPRLRLGLLALSLFVVMQVPACNAIFMSAAISAHDWVWIILAGCSYCALYILLLRASQPKTYSI